MNRINIPLIKFSILLIVLYICIAVSPAFCDEKKVLSFGVVPQQSAGKLARNWVPLLDYISARSGYTINFETAPDIPEFERRLEKGTYAFAYMNPYHYAVFSKTNSYRAFARQKGEGLVGILVVKKESNIKSIQDLSGKTIAFPSHGAFAASVITREHLLERGVDITPAYVGSHDSVYMTVAKGIYPAGGGVVRTLNNMERDVREQIDILWQSRPYTPHAFAVLPSVPDDVVKKIQQVMMEMNNDPAAADLLKGIEISGFEAARDSDWDDIRKLNIKELDRRGTQ